MIVFAVLPRTELSCFSVLSHLSCLSRALDGAKVPSQPNSVLCCAWQAGMKQYGQGIMCPSLTGHEKQSASSALLCHPNCSDSLNRTLVNLEDCSLHFQTSFCKVLLTRPKHVVAKLQLRRRCCSCSVPPHHHMHVGFFSPFLIPSCPRRLGISVRI